MRADRLVAATLYLQRNGRVTAADLAGHLEVSVATARRDLEALSTAGVPVYPQPGRGGGWQLVGGARTDLTGLTEPEVRALFVALGASGAGSAASTALAKLVRALPAPFREIADVAASAQRVDARAWQQRPDAEAETLPVLREAIIRRRGVTIGYRRPGGEARQDAVDPWRLVDKAGTAYLLAGTPRGPRTYRLDRISCVSVQDRVVERPDEAALDEQWRASAAVEEAARTAITARVRADPQALAVLADQFGTGFGRGPDDGEALVSAHTARGLAEQLAGWGSRVEVLEPDAVVEELRAIGAELVTRYGGPDRTPSSGPSDPRSTMTP